MERNDLKLAAAHLRLPKHEPSDGTEDMPRLEGARTIAHLICEMSRKQGPGNPFGDLDFWGAGDDGEYLIGVLDVLLEVGILSVSPSALNYYAYLDEETD